LIALCTTPEFIRHRTRPDHPERPERIAAIFQAVRAAGLISSPNPLPEVVQSLGKFAAAKFQLAELAPRAAELSEIGAIHSVKYIDHVRQVCRAGGVLDQGDTPVGPDSFDVALLSAGAVLTCCDAVAEGKQRRAFAAVRPPGHHAEPDRPMGFCLFANVAIAAKYLQARHSVGKIAIVDFDVHHGNGTQAAFEADPSVLFISLHQDPRTCYPGSGFDWETGVGPGAGLTLNIPLPPGSDDQAYIAAMDDQVVPRLEKFKPDFLLLSAGFDAHRDDPLAQMELSEEGFSQITHRLVDVADMHCAGRIVSALEGGYNLAALGRSVVAHLVAMRD
jgi:acetoin utilization deacetylase AcuC-like enzyme